MSANVSDRSDVLTPTQEETRLARESSKRLAGVNPDQRGHLVLTEPLGTGSLEIPASVIRLLVRILGEMAEGNAVAVIPVQTDLTTHQAAGLLGVSQPYLMRLLDEGKIPSRVVGTQRRVVYRDLMAYKQAEDQARLGVLEELTAQAQELDMGY